MVTTPFKRNFLLVCIWLGSLSALCIVPFLGLEHFSISQVLNNDQPIIQKIFWEIRVPRVITAWCIGCILAVSGMTFQALLRNALAEPFTLGIASGSALGASLYIHLGLTFHFWIFSGVSLFAFIGAFSTLLLIFIVNRDYAHSMTRLLLVGVILSFLYGSILMILQAIGNPKDAYRVMQWMMGSISSVGMIEVIPLAMITLIGTFLIALYTPKLNLMSAGFTTALTRGVNPNAISITLFIVVSVMIGVAISLSGPIGFVGLIVPHVMRTLIGQDHRYLWIGVCGLGGGLLVVSDLIARLAFAPSELPVGVITTLLGAPFFLWVLLKMR